MTLLKYCKRKKNAGRQWSFIVAYYILLLIFKNLYFITFFCLNLPFFSSNKTLPINLCWKPRSYFVMKIVTSDCIIFTRKFTCRNAEFLNWLFFSALASFNKKPMNSIKYVSQKYLKIIVYSHYYNPFSCFNINK